MRTTGTVIRQELRTASLSATVDVHMDCASPMILTIVIDTSYGEVEYGRLGDELSKWCVGTEVEVDLEEKTLSIFGWVILRWWVVTAIR